MEVGVLLNVVDGYIPSDLGTGTSEEIEEKRRLLNVAMTRAKDDLHLIVPQRFLQTRPEPARRPARLCVSDPLHFGWLTRFVSPRKLAACSDRCPSTTCKTKTGAST
jgi:superfamily I DNA/RNA helicase